MGLLYLLLRAKQISRIVELIYIFLVPPSVQFPT